MGLMDLFNQGDMREKLYSAASRNNVPQGGITGKLFSAMFPHGLGNLAFGREPEPMPPLETPEGTALMADLASNMMVPGTFIGPKGLARLFGDDAAKGMIATAESKLASGVPKESVFSELGVFKGPEGKWRYEIDDSGAKFASMKDGNGNWKTNRQKPANRALDHKELFSAYPDAAGIDVRYVNTGDTRGSHVRDASSGPEFISVNPRHGDGDSTLLHELQHAVQGREGFARGGSPEAMTAAGMGGKMPTEFKTKSGGTVKVSGGSAYFVRADGSFQPITHDVASRIWREEGGPTAFDQYLNLAGEAESRAVQDRMSMSMPERRASFPQYATRDDLIVRGLMSGGE